MKMRGLLYALCLACIGVLAQHSEDIKTGEMAIFPDDNH